MGGFDVNHARATLLSLGAVNINGVPVNGQVATWFDLDTIEGSANFTFDGTTLVLTGNQTTSGFHSFGAIPSLTGSIRLSNVSSIIARNQNDNGDFNVISFDASANMIVGDAGMPRMNFNADDNFMIGGLHVDTDQTGAFEVATAVGANILVVDTTNDEVELGSGTALAWSTDLKLFRDGPWELALRDGLNDNFFYVYGTFTDASNYERLAVYAGSSVNHFIEPQAAGTGDANINLTVRAGGSGILHLGRVSNGQIQLHSGFLTQVLQDGALTNTRSIEAVIATPSGQTATATNLIPSSCLVLAITSRVLTGITGPTGFDIGDGVDVDRWGASIPVALNTTSTVAGYTSSALTYFPAANDIVLTSDGVDFTGGSVRVTVHFMTFGAPTS